MNTQSDNTHENIHIPDIEAELNALWDQQKEKKQIKACLFNLIAYAPCKEHSDYLHDIIRTMLEKLPCRIIFIQSHGEAKNKPLSVHVSTKLIGQGSETIACDQISIDTGIEYLPRVPSIIIPHVVPDLPIYLLWGEDPTKEATIFPHLQKFATRIVFNSGPSINLQTFSQHMLQTIKHVNIEYMDISWALISSWRAILSEVFGSFKGEFPLSNCKNLKISYNIEGTGRYFHENQVIYLLGWLAGQMKWQFIKQKLQNKVRCLTYTDGSHEFTVELEPRLSGNVAPGSICRFELLTQDELHILISHITHLPQVFVHISTPDKCDLPYSIALPTVNRVYLLIELFHSKTSNHYQNMLKAISQVDWKEE